jgi:hypothetical protein
MPTVVDLARLELVVLRYAHAGHARYLADCKADDRQRLRQERQGTQLSGGYFPATIGARPATTWADVEHQLPAS